MPNWCYTNYRIYVSNQEELKELDAFLGESFPSYDWLGKILMKLNSETEEEVCQKYRTRSWLDCFDINYPTNCATLYIEDAWAPHSVAILELCKKFAPNAKILYASELVDEGEYYTNDPTYIGTRVYDDDYIEQEFGNDSEEASYYREYIWEEAPITEWI